MKNSGTLLVFLALVPRAYGADNLSFRGNMTWINAYIHLVPEKDTRLNEENSVLKLPQNTVISDVRPNLKISSSEFQIIVRPKIVAEVRQTKVGDKTDDAKGKVKSTVNEAFLNWTASNIVTFAYGRQSYQWGAAETINPSNRLFHDTSQNRNALYEIVGKDIARVNFTFGRSFSTVIMTEFQQNKDETSFVAEEDFASTGLIKSEVSWSGGTDYAGIVVGGRENESGWVGEYFNQAVPFVDGLFLYGDASHQRGGRAWYPVQSKEIPNAVPSTVQMQQTLRDESKSQTLAAGGLKFDFVNGTIWRAEYVYNDAGYSTEQLKLFYTGLGDKNPAQLVHYESNLTRFSANGLEFTGKRYAYMSLHVPDFFKIRDLTFFTRILRSVGDDSINGYGIFEYQLKDAGII